MMEINVNTTGENSVIQLSGNIDEQGSERLKEAFASIDLATIKEVRVECDNVSFIGSSAIGKLLLFYKNSSINGGRLLVTGLAPQVYDLFKELKLDTIFTVQAK